MGTPFQQDGVPTRINDGEHFALNIPLENLESAKWTKDISKNTRKVSNAGVL
jgi:hypothetical protein